MSINLRRSSYLTNSDLKMRDRPKLISEIILIEIDIFRNKKIVISRKNFFCDLSCDILGREAGTHNDVPVGEAIYLLPFFEKFEGTFLVAGERPLFA